MKNLRVSRLGLLPVLFAALFLLGVFPAFGCGLVCSNGCVTISGETGGCECTIKIKNGAMICRTIGTCPFCESTDPPPVAQSPGAAAEKNLSCRNPNYADIKLTPQMRDGLKPQPMIYDVMEILTSKPGMRLGTSKVQYQLTEDPTRVPGEDNPPRETFDMEVIVTALDVGHVRIEIDVVDGMTALGEIWDNGRHGTFDIWRDREESKENSLDDLRFLTW